MGNDFYNVIFKKIVWEIVLVWEGLQVFKSTGMLDNNAIACFASNNILVVQ